ncbi:MAG: hypothetical protein ACYSUC_05185 [Planctomycetota bacterium]
MGALPKWTKWLGLLILIVVLLVIFDFPGWPGWPAKMSPPALEHFNHSDFLYLAELMTEFEREMGRLPASFDEIEAFAQSEGYSLKCTASDLTLREKVSTPTIAFATPLGKVVILGVEKDDLGLVWAVTEGGIVIKVDPDKLTQQP